jgi:small subunit ribosomal protein S6
MTLPAPTYDLVLLLDPQSEESTRTKILTDTRTAIDAQGEIVNEDTWGERALTYPIDKKPNADYHLLQFHAASSELLDGLDRTLRITDGVMRFRIIKLRPGVPDAPDMGTATPAAPRAEAEPQAAEPAVEAEPQAAEPAVEAEPAPASQPADDAADGAVAELA